jgi:hypothetical protein
LLSGSEFSPLDDPVAAGTAALGIDQRDDQECGVYSDAGGAHGFVATLPG